MKLFIKNSTKKIIIALIVCMLIFNFVIPTRVYAWDVGGILFKPVFWLTTTAIRAFNSAIGIFLRRRR